MQKCLGFILLVILTEIVLSAAEVFEVDPDGSAAHENSSYINEWRSDNEVWDKNSAIYEEQDTLENEIESNLTISDEDEILYDIYSRQPDIAEEIDEDGLELSDDWLVLDIDEDQQSNENKRAMVKDMEIAVDHEEVNEDNEVQEEVDEDHEEVNDSIADEEQNSEVLDCEDEAPKSLKRKKKISNRKPKDDNFYFKHKKYDKKTHKRKAFAKNKRNWKKNCCIRGKKVGNTRRTFLSEDLFQECQERTRSLSSRMSRPCRWIFLSCCEAKALRRYYIHHKPGKSNTC